MGLQKYFSLGCFLCLCFLLALKPQLSHSLTLQEALTEAESQSPESQIWRAEDARIHAQKWQAWGEAFPQVNAYAQYGKVSIPIEMGAFGEVFGGFASLLDSNQLSNFGPPSNPLINTADQYSYGLEIQQSLFSFGRLSQTVKIANYEEKALLLSQQRRRNELKYQVLQAYGGVLLAQARLQVLKSSAQRHQENESFLERNFKAGAGARAHLLMAKAAVLALEPQILQAEKAVQISRLQLGTLLGRKTALNDSLQPIATQASLADTSEVNTSSPWENQRKDYKALELQIKSLEGQAKYMEMLGRPSLGASAKLGITAFEADQLADPDYRDWMIGLAFRWNLFNGRQNHYRSQQMMAEVAILQTRQQQMKNYIQMDIASALADARSCTRSLNAAKEAVEAAREAWELHNDAYKRGTGLLSDVLSSEEMYRLQELAVLAAYWECQFASVRLKLALGKDVL